jgi:subtilisin family serine protease
VQGLTVVKLPEGVKVKDAIRKLKSKSEFLYVQPNWKIKWASNFPNDPCFPNLWGLNNTGQSHPVEGGWVASGIPDVDIDAPQAWDIITDSNIVVAVLDSGVYYTHPDLAANMWVNPGEIAGNGIDDDNNGYIDDIYGWDFFANDSDPNDETYHRAHVAGIIGAVGNNGIGVTGVCWRMKIMAVRIGDDYGTTVATAINGMEYAQEMGAKVLNCSWGRYEEDMNYIENQALKDAIEDADACGVLFIAAAGNGYGFLNLPVSIDVEHFYPAGYDCNNIISVMATGHCDIPWIHSNYGPNSVDLAAPGRDIFSTFFDEQNLCDAGDGVSGLL